MTKSNLNLACVVGARPNFIKMAPLLRALKSYPHIKSTLVHTGQHYDENLSDVFFKELELQPPDITLEVGSGRHGAQTAQVLDRFEDVLLRKQSNGEHYDFVVVVGDVNSTMAAAITAAKLSIPVAHVEAGLRSFDRSMPEEINRVVTDSVCELFFVSEPAGIENLLKEGRPVGSLHLVGNVMIDTLFRLLEGAKKRDTLQRFGVEAQSYGVVTMHRPSNVDSLPTLESILTILVEVSHEFPLIFPVHPRTSQQLDKLKMNLTQAKGFRVVPPIGYLDFLALCSQSKVIITDSGGLQEESTALGIPCLTLRSNTERPITVTQGTSTLIGTDPEALKKHLSEVLNGTYKRGTCPELWDGKAAQRIAAILANIPH
jgi:UDP-N-acetylglucosamine 2-epimerase (non-hydrolysing)